MGAAFGPAVGADPLGGGALGKALTGMVVDTMGAQREAMQ